MQLQTADQKTSPHRLRWLTIGTALVIAAIVGANAIILAQLHHSTLREVQNNLLRQSLDLSELAERTLQAADLVLISVADKVSAVSATENGRKQLEGEAIHTFLKEKMSGLPQLHALGIVDADGLRINNSQSWPAGRSDYSSREYFQALKANPKLPSFLSGPVRGIVTGAWVVVIARPLLTKDGAFAGVVFASTDTKYFQELFRSTSLGDGYAATLLREDGTLLTRYPMAGETGTIAPVPLLGPLAHSRSGVSRSVSPIDHQPRIAAAYRLLDYPFIVVVSQSDQAVFAAWRTAALTICLITGLMIVVIIIAAGLIARFWKQRIGLNAARAEVVEADKVRALAEAELHRQRDLAEQSMRFTAAVENMTHGLVMFDKDKRLVVCNERFAALYKLPAELRKPGTPFINIITYRFFGYTSQDASRADAALR